jgi:CspA family cold shock protein
MLPARGVVSEYWADEGWGVIDGPDVPGGCWVNWSVVVMECYPFLQPGQHVEFSFEEADQDGYTFRAAEVRPPGTVSRSQTIDVVEGPSAAFSSRMVIKLDE